MSLLQNWASLAYWTALCSPDTAFPWSPVSLTCSVYYIMYYPSQLRPVILKRVSQSFKISDSNQTQGECGNCRRSCFLQNRRNKGLRGSTERKRWKCRVLTPKCGNCGKCGWPPHTGESHRPPTPILSKSIAIHLPFLSRYFCKSMPFS